MSIFARRLESNAIASAINFFQHGKFSENESYVKALAKGESVQLNGFSFSREPYCFCVWKYDPDPRYKGEPLVKVVPRFDLTMRQIVKILEAQPWSYI